MKPLLPPSIEGTLPAFYGNGITIPFMLNPAVGKNEIKGFVIKFKSIYDNNFLFEVSTVSFIDWESMLIKFQCEQEKLKKLVIGNSYKVQLACKDYQGQIGYYSTVGIIKYTTEPQVYIEGLDSTQINYGINSFSGIYSQKKIDSFGGDNSEKVYSYKFIVYKSDASVYEETEEILHNHENDDNIYRTKDNFILSKELVPKENYYIQYRVKTINNLKISSPFYSIKNLYPISQELQGISLRGELNRENAYIDLKLLSNPIKSLKGTYLITRTDSTSNYLKWDKLEELEFFGNLLSEFSYRDFTIQNGIKYKYAIQQFNTHGIYSHKIYSKEIEVSFEDIFLYDGKNQLKIKYNPKVSSFKETLQETKTNTLGNQFPFFFRNSVLKYKEFPISGLISYLSDEEHLFVSNDELGLDDLSNLKREQLVNRNRIIKVIENQRIATTNLVDYNIQAEQIFKNKVMDFLNDGKAKLFKSPIEGNMIVRLMNSSLTPNDQLGRMLHTFNTTATEIDKIDYNTLITYGLLNIKQTMVRKAKQKTILINKNTNNLLKSYSNQIIGFTCLDFRPTEKIKIKYNDTESDTIIEIGITGQYKAEFNKPIYSLEVFDSNTQGQIDILYYDNSASSFDNILSISEENITLKQLKLDDNHALGLISTIETPREDSITQIFNFTKEKDIEFEVQNYPFIRFVKRDDIQNVPYGVIINNETNIDLDKIGIYKIVGIDQNYIPEINFDKGVMVEISVERYKIEREEEE